MKKYSYNFEDALKVREDRPTYCCFSVDYNGRSGEQVMIMYVK